MDTPPGTPRRIRRNRLNGEKETKSFNLPSRLARAIEHEAQSQGHGNQSTIAEEAFVEYLNRRNDPRVA